MSLYLCPSIYLRFFAIAASLKWEAAAQTFDTNIDFVQTFVGSGFYGCLDGQGLSNFTVLTAGIDPAGHR